LKTLMESIIERGMLLNQKTLLYLDQMIAYSMLLLTHCITLMHCFDLENLLLVLGTHSHPNSITIINSIL
jgi:hypothetical protein